MPLWQWRPMTATRRRSQLSSESGLAPRSQIGADCVILAYQLPGSRRVTSTEITFDKLVYIDRLKSAGVDETQARAHAEALDQALRDTVATRHDLMAAKQELLGEITRLDHKIDVVGRDLTIRMGGMLFILFGALASIKFFG